MSSALARMFFDDDTSDDDDFENAAVVLITDIESNEQPTHGGSVLGRQVVPRDKIGGNEKVISLYFAPNPKYNAATFRRRYRMSKELFLRIATAVEDHDSWFKQKRNAAGDLGHSALKKLTVATRMLTYGTPGDSHDATWEIGESTAILSLEKFVKAVIDVFGEEYLRAPNAADTERLLQENAARGFPGMLGSIDCMHWRWDKCPTAWHGQFTDIVVIQP